MAEDRGAPPFPVRGEDLGWVVGSERPEPEPLAFVGRVGDLPEIVSPPRSKVRLSSRLSGSTSSWKQPSASAVTCRPWTPPSTRTIPPGGRPSASKTRPTLDRTDLDRRRSLTGATDLSNAPVDKCRRSLGQHRSLPPSRIDRFTWRRDCQPVLTNSPPDPGGTHGGRGARSDSTSHRRNVRLRAGRHPPS